MYIDEGFGDVPTVAAASVSTPAAGRFRFFFDSSNNNRFSRKDSSGVVTDLTVGIARHLIWRVLDKSQDWPDNATLSVGGDLVIPFNGNITDIEADVDTAGVTGTATIDVNKNGVTIMTTNKLNWDSAEKSTRTFSGTAPGLTTVAVATGDIITLDIDNNYTGTRAKGLSLYLKIEQT